MRLFLFNYAKPMTRVTLKTIFFRYSKFNIFQFFYFARRWKNQCLQERATNTNATMERDENVQFSTDLWKSSFLLVLFEKWPMSAI